MTQEEKDLLLQDLCGRLPYKVKCKYYDCYEGAYDEGIIRGLERHEYMEINGRCIHIEEVKPYLFPMSSMTKEQTFEIRSYLNSIEGKMIGMQGRAIYIIDWLNKHYFDYRGLIEKSLALDATGLNIY